MAVVRFREAADGIVTKLAPSKTRAFPKRPCVVQVTPLASVPVLVLPEASATTVPAPSPKEYAATSPAVGVGVGGGGTAFDTVTATFAATAEFPAASRARAESVWVPLATVPGVQEDEVGAGGCFRPAS